jgi:hypothetical protein
MSKRTQTKEPLFRKVNTRARNVRHDFGGDFRHERPSKVDVDFDVDHGSMHGRKRRGLDYTPLFKFLLSKVGEDWDRVFSEAVSRLDRPEPIFWMVALHEHEKRDYVGIGESAYYSGLFVDTDGRLQIVNPTLGPQSMAPFCSCCTHTFNGVRFSKPWVE